MLFLSCKANARVKLAKSGHGQHLFRIVICVVLVIVLCYCLYAVPLLLCCTVICVALLLFVLSYVLIVCTVPLPPGVNPIAVDKYIYLSVYYSYSEIHIYLGYSLYRVQITFHSLLHYQHNFPPLCKTQYAGRVKLFAALDAHCVPARRRPQNGVLEVPLSGDQKR